MVLWRMHILPHGNHYLGQNTPQPLTCVFFLSSFATGLLSYVSPCLLFVFLRVTWESLVLEVLYYLEVLGLEGLLLCVSAPAARDITVTFEGSELGGVHWLCHTS